MDVGKGREQGAEAFPAYTPGFAGNATSRYALGWPYSGLRHCSNKPACHIHSPVLSAFLQTNA